MNGSYPRWGVLLLSLIAGLVLMSACSPSGNDSMDAGHSSGKNTDDAPTPRELANMSYAGVIDDDELMLRNGHWEGEPFVPGARARPSVGLVEDFRLVNDLDGDGTPEAIVLLWQSSGGSGVFYYLAVASRDADGLKNTGTAYLGDRIQVRAARTREGMVELDVVQQGFGDAACCPTQLATRNWELTDEGLFEIASKVTGRASLKDLAGPEWVLDQTSLGDSLLPDSVVTLTFNDYGIAGYGGCNRYFATVEAGNLPGALKVNPAEGSHRSCESQILEQEHRYMNALRKVTGYSYLAGRLALNWHENGKPRSLLFQPREPQLSSTVPALRQ